MENNNFITEDDFDLFVTSNKNYGTNDDTIMFGAAAGPKFSHVNITKYAISKKYNPPNDTISYIFYCEQCYKVLLHPLSQTHISQNKNATCHQCGKRYQISRAVRQMWAEWNSPSSSFYLSRQQRDCIDKRLLNIKPPKEIHRLPRALKEGKLKASEWRSWTLFYSVPCLTGILNDNALASFILLVRSINVLLSQYFKRRFETM
ncbi:uncharacterized protein LOC105181391 isoform X3 [Harpegnathos saltator]|uniref:uncharacterized protein LOC105181391 isoform X3 n=1 Tax=Harpegnathos saltator TaxID=610380 RepID=UPI000DBED0E2|nr:uncharacterized protein LOC105181391 isoform X3 [Harpegnathos saltator]